MVNWYIYQLTNGLLRYTDIKPFWAKRVKPKLEELGYVINEDGTVSKKDDDTDTPVDGE